MCGIVGVFNFNHRKSVDRTRLKSATDIISHRGPDGEGFYFDDENGVGLGHRRLAIIDLSTGDQPMCNEDRSIWIVFNGEIYNFPELKKQLIANGHTFRTESDTEVIIHAYEEYGEDCPRMFNGIFAFAIWDQPKHKLFLARDHFGVKPLYYFYNHETFVFGSEIKAILKYQQIKPGLNAKALNFCLTLRHTPAPLTLFEGIYKIPASNLLTFSTDGISRLKSYWNEEVVINHERKEREWIQILQDNLVRAVTRQMISDVPVGISLSSGLDSGSLLSIMSESHGAGVNAFTIGFDEKRPEFNEIPVAHDTALMFNADFYSKFVSQHEYENFMEKYLWHLEEPIGNESAIAYYFVAEMAKGKVKVLLNGQGADEPFAGYDRYVGVYYADYMKYFSGNIYKWAARFTSSRNRKNQLYRLNNYCHQTSDAAKIASVASILSPEQRQLLFNSDFLPLVENEEIVTDIDRLTSHLVEGNLLEKMIFYDMFSSLSENLLLCEDKMAMAASIEARVPFLDYEFAKIALSIPVKYKIKNFNIKYIHKKACEKFLPKSKIYRKKNGFDNPLEFWLRNSLWKKLTNYVNSPDSITRKYLNREAVQNLIQEHQQGGADHQRFLFLLLSVESWADIFMQDRNENLG